MPKEEEIFEYKCRRCDKIHPYNMANQNPKADMLSFTIHSIALTAAWGGERGPEPQFTKGECPPLLMVHYDCKDGGRGISDLIGTRIVRSD